MSPNRLNNLTIVVVEGFRLTEEKTRNEGETSHTDGACFPGKEQEFLTDRPQLRSGGSRNLMHAKRQSSSEATHVVQATIGHPR